MSAERVAIEAAIERLMAGKPIRSTGRLSISQLVVEAGVQRWRLYEGPAVDLREKFEALVAGRSRKATPEEAELRKKWKKEQQKASELRTKNDHLRKKVDAYAQVILDLQEELERLQRTQASVTDIRSKRR